MSDSAVALAGYFRVLQAEIKENPEKNIWITDNIYGAYFSRMGKPLTKIQAYVCEWREEFGPGHICW